MNLPVWHETWRGLSPLFRVKLLDSTSFTRPAFGRGRPAGHSRRARVHRSDLGAERSGAVIGRDDSNRTFHGSSSASEQPGG
jgi:hypothetical protein